MSALAVYVHIPFCTVKCGYCDFNAYAGMDNLKGAYGRALVREVVLDAPLFAGRTISSIGFGGGTPGEVPTADIAAVIEALGQSAPFAPDAEISLEANPGTTSGQALCELRRAGVTRISLGAQSFLADDLRFLDRIHSPEATVAAVALAREAGFESVGLDLIYGLPGQTPERFKHSLDAAVALEPDHLSTYALTVEDGTPLARRVASGEVSVPDEDTVADLYDMATERLQAAGFEQYELSNWSKPGHQSRHNRTYWTDGDYLGLGAGAHGYVSGERHENIAHPRSYIAAVDAGETPLPALANRYTPNRRTAISDWLTARMRLIEGFAPQEFEAGFGATLDSTIGQVLADCRQAGVLDLEPRVRLTARGRLLHGEVSARFLAHLTRGSGLGTRN